VPTPDIDADKKELRAWARRQRTEFLSLSADQRHADETMLSSAFDALLAETGWKHIGLFIPLPGEPDVWTPANHAAGVALYAPRMMPENQLDVVMVTNQNELVRGPFGVTEPPREWPELIDLSILDAIFTPGLAFSLTGGRLGFGGGWYDRLLSRIPDKVVKVGVCWSRMLVDTVPMNMWDVRMDGILTEAGYTSAKTISH
jgi:5-formyltetrahydrofolate cyclo-ligase